MYASGPFVRVRFVPVEFVANRPVILLGVPRHGFMGRRGDLVQPVPHVSLMYR